MQGIFAPKVFVRRNHRHVPTDYRKPYDVRELVCRVVDNSDFIEFKPDYGVSTVCIQQIFLEYRAH